MVVQKYTKQEPIRFVTFAQTDSRIVKASVNSPSISQVDSFQKQFLMLLNHLQLLLSRLQT